jgi:hypothetical protein
MIQKKLGHYLNMVYAFVILIPDLSPGGNGVARTKNAAQYNQYNFLSR